MDFFQAQDNARKSTKKLIFYYALAIIGLIVSIYLAAFFLFAGGSQYAGAGRVPFWMPGLFWGVTAITLIIIATGTGFRVMQLRGGGSKVAEMMGGRRLDSHTSDEHERKLMNIVEEMSIASGVPVPDVYVMDKEEGINAFAAGYGPRDAAIGVTKGCMQLLNRDELQGVIAHEYSHIFNGDMRLNIRLIGILNGILVIHLLGMLLIRSQLYMRIGGGGGGRNKGQAVLVMMAFGLLLTVIGWLGVLFGRMIQAAVSRQREFLADAAAVQYTRNPEGLARALAKIKHHYEGSTIKDAHAAEMSHLFFSTGQKTWLNSILATHPPIDKRLEALNATHVLDEVARESKRKISEAEERLKQEERERKKPKKKKEPFVFRPEMLVMAAGTVSALQIDSARHLLGKLSEELKSAAHDTFQAPLLMYALLLSEDRDIRQKQVDELRKQPAINNDAADDVLQLYWQLTHLPSHYHLALVDIALPALRNMGKKAYAGFREHVEMLIRADGRQVIFEFSVRQILFHTLDAEYGKKQEAGVKHTSVDSLIPEISVLLSALSYASGGSAQDSWDAGIAELNKETPEPLPFKLLPSSSCTISRLEEALESLAQSSGGVHKIFLNAASHTVAASGKITSREAGLLRTMSAAIDIPLPLMIPEE